MQSRNRANRGFTLVELMIVIAIIALLVSVAIPSFLSARERSQNTRMINDLRVITGSFEEYAMENNGYPPDSYPGVVPTGMETFFTKINFTGDTILGGQWDWDKDYVYKAAVSAVSSTAPVRQWLAVDQKYDDGNLSTGNFVTGPGRYTMIIER